MGIKKLTLLISLLFLSLAAQAGYQLDNAHSSLYFVSIKKDKIGEVHTFEKLIGSVDDEGVAEVTVNLVSVKTNIEIRDERMRSLLLETDMFPTANVSANLDMESLASVGVGEVRVMPLELTLDLHGKSKLVQTELQIIGLNAGDLLVSTVKPIMLNAFDFGLGAGIKKLMDVAKLPSIALAVPVSFNLVFKAN